MIALPNIIENLTKTNLNQVYSKFQIIYRLSQFELSILYQLTNYIEFA